MVKNNIEIPSNWDFFLSQIFNIQNKYVKILIMKKNEKLYRSRRSFKYGI